MKKFIVICSIALATFGCAQTIPSAVVTPQGKYAYQADSIVKELGTLQNVAINLNASGALPEKSTKLIVQFVVSSSKVLRDGSNDPKLLIRNSLTELIRALPANDADLVRTILTVISAMIGA